MRNLFIKWKTFLRLTLLFMAFGGETVCGHVDWALELTILARPRETHRDIEYFKLYAQSVGFVVDHDAINPVHNKNMQIDSKLFDLVAFHEDLMLSTNNIINILKI